MSGSAHSPTHFSIPKYVGCTYFSFQMMILYKDVIRIGSVGDRGLGTVRGG